MYAGDAGNVTFGVGPELARICFRGTLSRAKAEGGIVLCDAAFNGTAAIDAHAAGIIMPSSYDEIVFGFSVPAVLINLEDHDELFDYIKTTE